MGRPSRSMDVLGEFAERNGWTILKEFQEKGVSGFKVSASDRDAIQDLKAAAEEVSGGFYFWAEFPTSLKMSMIAA